MAALEKATLQSLLGFCSAELLQPQLTPCTEQKKFSSVKNLHFC